MKEEYLRQLERDKKNNKIFLITGILILVVSINYLIYLKKNTIVYDSSDLSLGLVGSESVDVQVGTQYIDSGYSIAVSDDDSEDSKINEKIEVSSNVDTTKTGDYTVSYSITDKNDVKTEVKRKVNVVDEKLTSDTNVKISKSNINYTEDSINLIVVISGSNYNYMILPNNKKSSKTTINYKVTKNGVYKFNIYDKNGATKEYKTEVTNIDLVSPAGNCTANTKNNITTVNVTANDLESGVNNYKYILDSHTSNITSNSTYKYNSKITNAKVLITDNVGNSTTLTCNLTIEEEPPKEVEKTLNALFIGNSFTYCNDMYLIFKKIAASKGHSVYADQLTVGGYTLQQHLATDNLESKLSEKKWDVVFIQEQSSRPVNHKEIFFDSVSKMKKKILEKNSNTRVILYMTWPYKEGSEKWSIIKDESDKNPTIMGNKLSSAYIEVGKKYNLQVSPVGKVFIGVNNNYSDITLYRNDKYHPNLYGSYLAALTHYATVYNEKVSGIKYLTSAPDIEKKIQSRVDAIVFK